MTAHYVVKVGAPRCRVNPLVQNLNQYQATYILCASTYGRKTICRVTVRASIVE